MFRGEQFTMVNGHWDRVFDGDSSFAPVSDPLEEHYENWVFGFRKSLFPDHFCYRFKPLLVSDHSTGVRPDLVLIDHHYAEWVLVEVEKFSHSWSAHVSPQLEKFRSARIGDREVQVLQEVAENLDPARLRSLMLNVRPRILVVCNGVPTWSAYFLASDAELMVARPLRNERLELIMYVDRQFQRRHFDRMSHLEAPKDDALVKWYRISSPNRLAIQEGQYLMQLDNGVTPCRTKKLGDDWYLVLPSSVRIMETNGRPLSIMRFGITEIAVDGRMIES